MWTRGLRKKVGWEKIPYTIPVAFSPSFWSLGAQRSGHKLIKNFINRKIVFAAQGLRPLQGPMK